MARLGLYQHRILTYVPVLGGNGQVGIAAETTGCEFNRLRLVPHDIRQRRHLRFGQFDRSDRERNGVLERSRSKTANPGIVQQNRLQQTIG